LVDAPIARAGKTRRFRAGSSTRRARRSGELQQEISVTAGAPQVARNPIAVGDLVDLRGAEVLK
jgi:hypothetical protein